jgi:hypothetical protein
VRSSFFALMLPFSCRLAVNPLIRRRLPARMGLRLLARALFSGSDPDESSSIGMGLCIFCLRAAERVVGPKYPSLPLSSEGVGDGDMTRGVCGIWYCLEESMACRQHAGKEGSGGGRMRPVKSQRALA